MSKNIKKQMIKLDTDIIGYINTYDNTVGSYIRFGIEKDKKVTVNTIEHTAITGHIVLLDVDKDGKILGIEII